MKLRRHDLVDVSPDAWRDATAALTLPRDAAACVVDWARRGRPAIVRRRLAGEDDAVAPLAIQLPNALGRLRLAFSVPLASVAPRAPVILSDAAGSTPRAWTRTISALIDLVDRLGEPRIYGGLLWQHLTGEAVLREASDLDLLWHPAPERRGSLVEALASLDGVPRLDGEIVLDDGAGVSWRELQVALAGRAKSVAAKTIDGVEMRDLAAILQPQNAPC